jgi:hypothetical protein
MQSKDAASTIDFCGSNYQVKVRLAQFESLGLKRNCGAYFRFSLDVLKTDKALRRNDMFAGGSRR